MHLQIHRHILTGYNYWTSEGLKPSGTCERDSSQELKNNTNIKKKSLSEYSQLYLFLLVESLGPNFLEE